MDKIVIKGARENNLKNIDIDIPKNKLVVMTGVSGSGKSSLAFDTIYAEGQRRYMDSLSAYARQFIGNGDKPQVDSIEGLSPSIAIDQKTTNKNPRSTVGTITEIYDYLRLLYARIGIPYCKNHHIPIKSQSVEEMTNKVLELPSGTNIDIYSPVVRGEKGVHKELIDSLFREGYTKIRINGEFINNPDEINLDKNIKDNIEVLIDRIEVSIEERSRIFEALEVSTRLSNGLAIIKYNDEELLMSENYACPHCNFSIGKLEPRMFSFNAPYGACDECKGLGTSLKISEELLIPDKNKSIKEGAIVALNLDNNMYQASLDTVAKHYNIDLNQKVKDMPKKDLNIILYGTKDVLDFHYVSKTGSTRDTKSRYEGIVNNLERRYLETNSSWIREWISGFMVESTCKSCNGTRLKDEVLAVKINGKNIYEVTILPINEMLDFINNLKLSKEEIEISELILKEIKNRLQFLINVGLNYLTLERRASTLSGGEAQRIRLATQIGSRLTGVLYVLDEPSIGLHQRDNDKLINSLKDMRDLGNTLIVVEHDTDTMLAADYLIDVGPGAGEAGGKIVAAGTPEEVMNNKDSITGAYLRGEKRIEIPKTHRKGNGLYLEVEGAKENNLKNVNVKFPLNKFICVTGVSGSGKSSLVNEILYKYLRSEIYNSKDIPGNFKKIKGLENIDKVVNISQDAIGRTPRSNPATYVGVFDDIRDVFANMKESKIKGYDKSRFSFNVKGGRCEACYGDGVKKIEMHFLPDVYVPCEVCGGKRYNKETLEVKFKGLSIADVLDLRVSEALLLFENIPKVRDKLQVMVDVGLSYIKLGQAAPTLSGGEAGRVKLAKELQKKATGKSLFILDEPTTGLHTDDIKKLLEVLNRIVDNGDTVVVIEHNLDVIKQADYIIDLGPEGGKYGGEIIASGTPEDIINCKKSYTGKYLEKIFAKENKQAD